MSKTILYYFSATGNSLAVARHLAEVLGVGSPVSVPGSLVNEDPYIDARGAQVVGFVFPVQRATIPEMLRGFIQLMPIDPSCYYFAVSTYSLFGCNEFWDIDELLVSKGAALNYAAGVRMMGNVGLKEPSDATIAKRLAHMERKTDEMATAITYHQENFFPRSNKVLGWLVRTYTDLYRRRIVFHIGKRCRGCGICVQVCPAQNVQLSVDRPGTPAPIRSDKCMACLACVHWCPAAAVSTSRRKHISYHNPRVLPEHLHSTTPRTEPQPSKQAQTSSAPELPPDDEAPQKDLLAPAGSNTENSEDERSRTPRRSRRSSKLEKLEPSKSSSSSMSNEEIVRALSELE